MSEPNSGAATGGPKRAARRRISPLLALGWGAALSACAAPSNTAPVAPGTEIDVTSCMWSETAVWDGRENGFGGIDRFAFYGLQYLEAHLPGGHFRFRGEFPQARYFGFQTYDEKGHSIAYGTDSRMAPDPGSVNPFAPGVAWHAGEVSYTLDLLDVPPAERESPPPPHVLYGGYRSADGQRVSRNGVEYRIYLPSRPAEGLPGGVDLPRVLYVVDDPATTRYTTVEEVCFSNQTGPGFAFTRAADGLFRMLAPVFDEIRQPPSLGGDPLHWVASVRGECCFPLWPNHETAYLAAQVNFLLGEVLAVRFKVPTFPDSSPGEPLLPHQVRYWSICSVQNVNFFYTSACLHGGQVHPDAQGFVTIAQSSPENRPAPDGEPYADWLPATGGAPFLFIREIVPDAELFPESPYFLPPESGMPVSNYHLDEELRQAMGAYYPAGRYCSRERFEADRCGLEDSS